MITPKNPVSRRNFLTATAAFGAAGLAAPALEAVVAEVRAFFIALDPWAGDRHPGHGQPQPQQTP